MPAPPEVPALAQLVVAREVAPLAAAEDAAMEAAAEAAMPVPTPVATAVVVTVVNAVPAARAVSVVERRMTTGFTPGACAEQGQGHGTWQLHGKCGSIFYPIRKQHGSVYTNQPHSQQPVTIVAVAVAVTVDVAVAVSSGSTSSSAKWLQQLT